MSTIDKETLVFGMIESNSDKIAKINLVGKTVKDILVGEYTRHENCLETDSLFMLIFDDGNDISFQVCDETLDVYFNAFDRSDLDNLKPIDSASDFAKQVIGRKVVSSTFCGKGYKEEEFELMNRMARIASGPYLNLDSGYNLSFEVLFPEESMGVVLLKNNDFIPTGFKDYDHFVGGLKPGNLMVIASYPSAGCISFGISMAVNLAFGEKPVSVGFLPYDMRAETVEKLMFANMTKTSLSRLSSGSHLEYTENLTIEGKPSLYLDGFISQVRTMADNGVKVVFTDGVGLLPKDSCSTEVSKALSLLADELKITIVCFCPIMMKQKTKKSPLLIDLKDYGLIYRFADVVVLLDDTKSRVSINDKQVKVIVAKNRDGNCALFDMKYNKFCCCFQDDV